MNNIELYIPKLKDYWYEAKVQSDPDSMSYNAGYDVLYFGYHYDTGCIDFPEEKWEETYNKRINDKKYFAYVKDNDLNEFVGYVNYHYNKNDDRYECGILIDSNHRGKGYSKKALELLCEEAKKNGVKELYDNFELDRKSAFKVFVEEGFEVVEKQTWKKFGRETEGIIIKKVL